MNYFYEKNRELLESNVNKTFEEVLWMSKDEFRQWAIDLRKTVVELWDEKVLRNKIIESKFNRLVLMETNNKSWHSVSKSVNKFKSRNCVSNYYFSKYSISGKNYNNVTKFSGRPEQKFIRFYCTIDNCLRQFLRIFNKKGFSKVDLNKKIS